MLFRSVLIMVDTTALGVVGAGGQAELTAHTLLTKVVEVVKFETPIAPTRTLPR